MHSAFAKNLARSVAYVRIPARQLEESAQFALAVLGLEADAGPSCERAFRADERLRAIVFAPDAEEACLGVELADDDALSLACEALGAQGLAFQFGEPDECRGRGVHRLLKTRDASGNRIELVTRPSLSARPSRISREVGIVAFQGVGLRSTAIEDDLRFWTRLGARVSDRVGDIAYLALDERHHRIALYPSEKRGLLNLALEVEAPDNVMQNAYRLEKLQVRIAQGPGRETASGQIFVHFHGPDEVLFSYVAGMNVFTDAPPRPRQFSLLPDSLCAWGSLCHDIPELRAPAEIG